MCFTAMLTLAMAIGPFSVHAVSALSPLVIGELLLSRTELGSIATLTFGVAALGSWFGGRGVDRARDRAMMLLIFAIGALSVAAMAGAQSLAWLWLGAALSGVSQIIANPGTNRMISTYSPPGRQGLTVGIKQSGVQMSQALAGFGLPLLAVLVGWRIGMLLGVVLAAAGMVLAWRILPRAAVPSSAAPAAAAGTEAGIGSTLLWLVACNGAISIAVQAVAVYIPLYVYEAVGLSATLAGMASGTLALAGIAARIAWTRQAERRRDPAATLQMLAGAAFLSLLAILCGEYLGPWILWPGLLGFGASAFAVNAVVMLAVIRASAGRRTGRASGIVAMGFFVGFMIGPLGCGFLIDVTGSYTLAWSVAAALCLAALLLASLWRASSPRAAVPG